MRDIVLPAALLKWFHEMYMHIVLFSLFFICMFEILSETQTEMVGKWPHILTHKKNTQKTHKNVFE